MKHWKILRQRWSALWHMHRSAVLIIGLFAVLGTALLVRSMAATEPPFQTDSGEFIHGVADDFKSGQEFDRYSIKQADGQYLDVTIDPAKARKTPRTGSKVHIRGRRHGKNLAVTNEAEAGITVDAPPSGDTAAVGPAQLSQPGVGSESAPEAAATAPRIYTRGVLIVKMTDSAGAGAIGLQPTPRSASEENGYLSGQYGPDKYWAESSYGQLSLTSTVLGTVSISVSDTDCSPSTVYAWTDKANAAAMAAGINISQFTNMAYLLPIDSEKASSSTCKWGGYSDIGGARTWLQYAYAGFNSAQNYTRYIMGTEAHEFGHNLGLLHSASYACSSNGTPVMISSSCSSSTYGDLWDVMGSQAEYRLLDSYHREQLGFIPPAKIKTVTASGTYTIASSDLAPSATTLPQSLRIARTGALPAQYYEIESRSPSGTSFDSFSASSKVALGFTLRLVPAVRTTDIDYSYLLNAVPADPSDASAPFYDEVFSDPAAKTAVKLVSRTANTITLSVTINGVAPPTPTGDNIYPTVNISSPQSNTSYTVGDSIPIAALAYDNMSVAKVEYYDGTALLGSSTAAPYSFSWKTAGAAAGMHTIKVQAYDPNGNYGWNTVTLALKAGTSSDTTPPTVTMAMPSSSSYTIGSTVNLAAAASDNVGVAKVEFYDGTKLLGADTASPFSYAWSTTGAAAGTHNLTAKAYDAAGNTNQTKPIPITLTVVSTPPPPTASLGDCSPPGGDGHINALDLSAILSHDGQNYPACDWGGKAGGGPDGVIGAADLAIVLAHWTW